MHDPIATTLVREYPSQHAYEADARLLARHERWAIDLPLALEAAVIDKEHTHRPSVLLAAGCRPPLRARVRTWL